MAYRDDIIALSPDHVWRFDGDALDGVGSTNGAETGISAGAALTEDASASRRSNATGDRIAVANTADVNGALDRKAIGGWINIDSIQPPPKSIYREGATVNQLCFVCWAGNNIMLDIVNGSQVKQLFSQQVATPGRTYHLFMKFSGSSFDDRIDFYIDGVLQGSTTADAATLENRGSVSEWSDPSGSTEVGNATVLLNGLVNCDYAYWASWSGAGAQSLTAAQIREELVEKGALPGVTISSDTEVNMQAALDAIASTVRPDEVLSIRVEDVSGGGVLNLAADNITFNPLTSIHVQFSGAGTLNWTNTNGANASIGSTTNGGTLNLINPAVLTVAPLVAASEVRVLESGTTNEVAGVESTGTSFSASVSASVVDVIVANNEYEFIRVDALDMTSGDLTLPISQVFDRQYENP